MIFTFSNRIHQSVLTLTAFFCFTLIAFTDQVHASRAITGADIADAIVQTLELEGKEAGPKILGTKKYFPCDAPLEILPAVATKAGNTAKAEGRAGRAGPLEGTN